MRGKAQARPGFTVVGLAIILIIVVALVGGGVVYFMRLGQQGIRERMETDLKQYAFAQEEYLSEQHRFASRPEELPEFRFAEGTVVLKSAVEGASRWEIVLGHEDSRWQCSLAGGVGSGVEAVRPSCVEGQAEAKPAATTEEDSLDLE